MSRHWHCMTSRMGGWHSGCGAISSLTNRLSCPRHCSVSTHKHKTREPPSSSTRPILAGPPPAIEPQRHQTSVALELAWARFAHKRQSLTSLPDVTKCAGCLNVPELHRQTQIGTGRPYATASKSSKGSSTSNYLCSPGP